MLASQTFPPGEGVGKEEEGGGEGIFAVNSTQDMPAREMDIPWVLARNMPFLEKSYRESVLPFLWLK